MINYDWLWQFFALPPYGHFFRFSRRSKRVKCCKLHDFDQNLTANICNLPSITSKKSAYTDDLAILYSSGDWKVLERTLSEGMTTLSIYPQTWWLKLSHAKAVTAAFHLHNQETKRELKVNNNFKFLPFCLVSIYLDVKLDKALTHSHHLEALQKNYPRAFRCWGDLRVQDGALVPKHCA